MAKKVVKKKVAKKKVSSKNISKKRVLVKNANSSDFVNPIKSPTRGFKVSWNALVFFGVLFLISAVSYSAVSHEMYRQLFFLLSLAFGSISAALVLAILVYFFYSRIKFSRK